MSTPQTARATADHRHLAGETCPYCEQAIPNDRAEEIRARFDLKRKQDEAALKDREDKRVAEARSQIEAAGAERVLKAQRDAAALIEKEKSESAAKQAAAREEGMKLAAASAQQRLDAMAAEQAAANEKLDQLEKDKLAAVKQAEELKANQDQVVAQRTAEVRAAYEKDGSEKLNAQAAKHAEEIRAISERMKALEGRLNVEEGEGANIKLLDVLKKLFPNDDIKPIRNSSGADIIHVVKHNRRECGVIVYDSRNRKKWKTQYATELRRDMIAAKAMHAILTTNEFPKDNRQVCLFDRIIVANPARVAVVAGILRDDIVRSFGQRTSEQNRERKTARLYDFIASERFDKVLESLEVNDDKLLALDEEEQKVHKKTWEKRRLLTTSSQKLHGNLRTEIDRIIGTAEAE